MGHTFAIDPLHHVSVFHFHFYTPAHSIRVVENQSLDGET